MLKFTLLLLVALSMAAPAGAQGTSVTYEWSDYGLSFEYPAAWTYRNVDNRSGSVLLSQISNPNYGDDMLFVFSAPWVMALYPPDADFFSPELALKSFFVEFGLDTETALGTSLGNSAVAIVEYRNEADETAYLVMDNSPESNLLALVFPTNPDHAGIALDIAESIRLVGGAGQAAVVEACVALADGDAVQLRVGPGLNRGVIAQFPTGVPVSVTGQAKAEDGTRWYRLTKAEVAPDTEANEIWVSSAVVTTTGDCESVPAVAPPPIIPFDLAAS